MSIARRWWRPTIRVRLTLLYAVAFFLAGAILVTLMYLYLRLSLDHQQNGRAASTEPRSSGTAMTPCAPCSSPHSSRWASSGSPPEGSAGCWPAGRWRRCSTSPPPPAESPTAACTNASPSTAPTTRSRTSPTPRRFVANASHELRTPLAINRTLIEVALDNPDASDSLRQLGGTLLAVNQRHERLIDGMLTLASGEQAIIDPAPVDLADIAGHLTTQSHPAAQTAGIDMRTDLRPAPVMGDPILLERLTQNLLDNAIRYNLPEGGHVTVTTGTVDGNALLTVANTGPPVPAYEIPGLFEPFRRLPATERLADPTTPTGGQGAGLGLSIVRSVARAHGGDVHAIPRPDGGLTIHVRLPALATEERTNSPDRTPTRTFAASERDSPEGRTQPE